MWRMVFIFLFQNVVWVVVNAVELFCDSTPKIVKERSKSAISFWHALTCSVL